MERLKVIRNFSGDGMMVHKVPVYLAFLRESLLKHVGDVVGTNDAAIAPNLYHIRKIDHPFVRFIGLVNDIKTLDERAQERDIDCLAQVFEQAFPLLVRACPSREREMAIKHGFDLLPLTPERRSEADKIYSLKEREMP